MMTLRLLFLSLTLGCGLAGFSGTAQAVTTTSTLGVSVTVTGLCSVAAWPLQGGSASAQTNAGVNVNCTRDTPYSVGLSNDGTRGFGNTAGVGVVSAVSSGGVQALHVHGQVSASQVSTSAPDAVTVTVTY